MATGFALTFIVAISLYFIFAFYSENQFAYWVSDENFYILKPGEKQHQLGKCVLPQMDSWDESILKYFNPLWGYQAQCTTAKIRSKMSNGKLVAQEKNDTCWGRCLNRTSDTKYKTEAWQRGAGVFECDVIEARCSRTPNIEDFDYIWVHTQIYEKKELKQKAVPAASHTYDVMLIVLDSTSHTQSNRNIPKTVNYLTKSLGGVQFPYLNRVAVNSKPNAVSLFLGEIAEPVNRDIFGEPSLDPTMPINELCKTKLDNYTFLQDNFEKEGYVTSFYEDWSVGLYNYYMCVGLVRSPTTHTNMPFRSFWTSPYKEMAAMQRKNSCTSKHQMIFDHVAQFVNSYEGIPKFTSVWDTDFGHDALSSSIGADTILYDFFLKNRAKLRNSFIIVMGDHGLRMGSGSSSKLGLFDQNNPMLLVVPPKNLSTNGELMTVLRENAQKLQTHHDIRQTLLDILRYQPAVGYADQEPMDTSKYGSSFLRKQLGERTCRTLPIPFQYCICTYETKDLDTKSPLASKIGEFVASELNTRLSKLKISDKCNVWTFKEMSKLQRVDVVDNVDVYKIEAVIEPKAEFKTIVRQYRNGTMAMGAVDRSDKYGKRGDCIPDASHRSICDCMTKTVTTTTADMTTSTPTRRQRQSTLSVVAGISLKGDLKATTKKPI